MKPRHKRHSAVYIGTPVGDRPLLKSLGKEEFKREGDKSEIAVENHLIPKQHRGKKSDRDHQQYKNAKTIFFRPKKFSIPLSVNFSHMTDQTDLFKYFP